MSFELHPRLAADTRMVGDLPLCRVLLMNDARFPWLILVPRQPDLREVYQLADADQIRLWQEATRAGEIMMAEFEGDKLNLAALGNQVPQLHLHVIVRRETDAAWPGPVWGQGQAQPYAPGSATDMLQRLRQSLLE